MDAKINWGEILIPEVPWTEAYPLVEAAALTILENVTVGHTLSTEQLAEHIWPEMECRGEAIMRRPRLFRALEALAKHGLASCVSFEEDTTSYWAQRLGKVVHRKRWHAPDPTQQITIGTSASLVQRVTNLEQRIQTLEGYHAQQGKPG